MLKKSTRLSTKLGLVALFVATAVAACGDDAAGTSAGQPGAGGSGAGHATGGGVGTGGDDSCDLDGDGFDDPDCEGLDCDDDDASVHPDASDGATTLPFTSLRSDGGAVPTVIDPAGAIHVFNGDKHLTYASGGWTEETFTNEEVGGLAAAVDADGHLHVVFSADNNSEVLYATNAGGSWSTELVANVLYLSRRALGVTVVPDGTVHVVRNEDDVFHHVRSAGGSWSEAIIATDGNNSLPEVALASDSQGILHLVYDGWNNHSAYLRYDGSSWMGDPTVPIFSRAPRIAIDEDDNVHIVTGHSGLPDSLVQYASNASGTWVSEMIDAAHDATRRNGGMQLALAVDGGGNPLVAYPDGWPNALVVANRINGAWVKTVVDARGDAGNGPGMAVDGDGRVHVIHRDYCAHETRHSVLSPPNGVDDDCDGVVDGNAPAMGACDLGASPEEVAFAHECVDGQGTFSSHVAESRSAPELHFVGVYESPTRAVEVHVDRATPAVLVLSSYEEVRWKVTGSDDACLQKIIVNSPDYFGCVNGPEGVEVEYFTNDEALADCAYAYPSSTGGCESEALITAFEQHTGLSMASFAGCYQSTGFTLGR